MARPPLHNNLVVQLLDTAAPTQLCLSRRRPPMDSPYCPSHAPFFGFVGAALALIFGNMGAACAAAPGPVADSLYGEWRCVTDRAPPQVRDVEVGRRPRHHLQTAAPQGAPARPLAIPSAYIHI